MGFPGGTSGKEPTCQSKKHKRRRFDPWIEKIPWRRVWQSTPVFLPGESHRERSLQATVHRVAKSWTWLKQLSMHFFNAWSKSISSGVQQLCPEDSLISKVKVKLLSCVRLFAPPWTVAYQAPPSMRFSRQEYWSGLPFPSPGDLPNPGIEPGSPAL